jgi:hypothetical protein
MEGFCQYLLKWPTRFNDTWESSTIPVQISAVRADFIVKRSALATLGCSLDDMCDVHLVVVPEASKTWIPCKFTYN